MPVLRPQSYQLATGPVSAAPVGGDLSRANGGVTSFSDAEIQKFVSIFAAAAEQQRDSGMIRCDQILMNVAQARALDMGTRRYFSHTSPDGLAANYYVRQAGYTLPSNYGTDRAANNVESIGAGTPDAQTIWTAWLNSTHHRAHLTGSNVFFREQIDFGIGRAVVNGSPYQYYWCFLSARRP